ncbi:MAG TPA: hypothetical protein VGB31_02790 [Myxococcota bacterium]
MLDEKFETGLANLKALAEDRATTARAAHNTMATQIIGDLPVVASTSPYRSSAGSTLDSMLGLPT